MINKKNKLNKIKIRRLLIITVFILLLIISILIKFYKKNNKYKDLTILYNNELIELQKEIIIDDKENIFFSKDDVQALFDNTIYYNEAEKELITTYNKHVALLKIDEENAIINDENIQLNGILQEIDKQIYLPIKDLQVVYDIDVEYCKKTNRIIIDSTLSKKIESIVSKKTKVKSKKGLFGSKIEKLIIGDKVVILADEGKYKKIRTPIGNIGYIKKSNLSNEEIVREEEKKDKKELVIYKNYSNISGIYDNIQVDESKLNVVIPTFFYIDKNASVLDKTTNTTATYSIYKNWVDSNKLTILPTLTNNETVSNSLLSYSQRSTVINSLKKYLIDYNYIGINIEFNSIDEINSFYRFILEMVPRFKSSNLKVAVTLNNNIDKSKLENVVDYIIEK